MRKTRTTKQRTLLQTVSALRDYVLSFKDGALIGSETELVARFGVSRPTFRHAAKVLEQEQLLRIKRGVQGGFFARMPTPTAVAHVASVYLYTRRAHLQQAVSTGRALFAECARQAAKVRDPESVRRFTTFLATQKPPRDKGEFKRFLAAEREFFSILCKASHNPVLELFASVIVDFASTFVAHSVYSGHPERIVQYQKLQSDLIRAILAGDEEVASLKSIHRTDVILQWIAADAADKTGAQKGNRKKQRAPEMITFKNITQPSG